MLSILCLAASPIRRFAFTSNIVLSFLSLTCHGELFFLSPFKLLFSSHLFSHAPSCFTPFALLCHLVLYLFPRLFSMLSCFFYIIRLSFLLVLFLCVLHLCPPSLLFFRIRSRLRPQSSQIWPGRTRAKVEFGPKLTVPGSCFFVFGDFRVRFGRHRPNLTEFKPISAAFGPNLDAEPNLANPGPILVDSKPKLACSMPSKLWSTPGQIWSDRGRVRTNLGRSRAIIRRFRANLC